MAIGAARLFGIRLPINFHSPYKATNIIDFWRRWHITLSRFLRDYLYIPLGGNRKGRLRQYTNLLLVMLIGGLWHGAAYNFIIWGGLHGIYLMINNIFRAVTKRFLQPSIIWRYISWIITFTAVVFAWVPFRAATFNDTKQIWLSMTGFNGFALPPELLSIKGFIPHQILSKDFVSFNGMFPISNISNMVIVQLFLMLIICLLMPNTQEIMRKYRPGIYTYKQRSTYTSLLSNITWRMNIRWGVFLSCVIFFSIISLTNISEFLYFQF